MIRVTIWNEFVHEQADYKFLPCMKNWILDDAGRRSIHEKAELVRSIHNGAIHNTLRDILSSEQDMEVCHIATQDMSECGLTEEVLGDTDVLLWWSHCADALVPDEVAERVCDHVRQGMGVIFLHSAHMCKPMRKLLGTSCTLRYREGDCERLWCCNPAHPIARIIPVCVWLPEEEMYGEYFDIPTPDELVFLASFGGGEVFRSGCVWNRGYGKIFYFQPGHETNRSYLNPDVQQILRNAVRYLAPAVRVKELCCMKV